MSQRHVAALIPSYPPNCNKAGAIAVNGTGVAAPFFVEIPGVFKGPVTEPIQMRAAADFYLKLPTIEGESVEGLCTDVDRLAA